MSLDISALGFAGGCVDASGWRMAHEGGRTPTTITPEDLLDAWDDDEATTEVVPQPRLEARHYELAGEVAQRVLDDWKRERDQEAGRDVQPPPPARQHARGPTDRALLGARYHAAARPRHAEPVRAAAR